MNWYFGWGMILTAFVTGAVLGLFFYREDFLGGYASFRRRIIRLGHIALAALGMINVLYGLSSPASDHSLRASIASLGFIIGVSRCPRSVSWHPGASVFVTCSLSRSAR
jgi:hypothetical protein